MPSTYAHYVLGQKVLKSLYRDNCNIAEVIENNLNLYNIGLHGPDILFYYDPLYSNSVNQTGYSLHDKKAIEFFESAQKTINSSRDCNKSMAYMLGYICHFALDSECHGYIDEKINKSGISHTEIEVEFDRSLMCKAGYNPLKHSLINHIVPSDENAEIIAQFYPGISDQEVLKSLNSMIKYNNLLLTKNRVKRSFVNVLLKYTGNYKEMHGLMVNYKANPECVDSCKELDRRLELAAETAGTLITEYYEGCLDERPLNVRFNRTFGVDKDIVEAFNVETKIGEAI